MEYIYAALLLDAAGKDISEKSLTDVIKAAGMTPDEAMAKSVATSLKDVNIKDVIKNAQNVQAAAPAAPAAKHDAAKKEPVEEKVSEEQAAGGLASLFG